jgi:hypothetical protein
MCKVVGLNFVCLSAEKAVKSEIISIECQFKIDQMCIMHAVGGSSGTAPVRKGTHGCRSVGKQQRHLRHTK